MLPTNFIINYGQCRKLCILYIARRIFIEWLLSAGNAKIITYDPTILYNDQNLSSNLKYEIIIRVLFKDNHKLKKKMSK